MATQTLKETDAKKETAEQDDQDVDNADLNTEENLQKLLKGYNEAVRYVRPLWQRRINNFNLLEGKIRQRKYKSAANFHVPYARTLLENVYSLLVASKPRGGVQPRLDDRDRDAAENAEQLITYTQDVNQYERRIFLPSVREMMEFDTSWAKVWWNYVDEKTDCPKIDPVDTFHVLAHPRKLELDDRWPIYHYSEMTKDQMKERGWDEEAIEKLSETKMNDDEWRRKRLQSLGYLNSLPYDDEELFPVVEIWLKTDIGRGKEEMAYFVIGNEEAFLNATPIAKRLLFQSPYDHQYFPYVPMRYNPRGFVMFGQSFIDPISSQQQELNALENMKVDNYKLRNNPPFQIMRGANVDTTTIRFEAGAPLLTDIPNGAQFLELPDLSIAIENQQQMLRQTMQDLTGANDVLLVSDINKVKGGDSATGASIAQENTQMRFQPVGMEIDFFNERIANIIIALYQQPSLMDRTIKIGVTNNDGQVKEKSLKLKDIQGDIQYRMTSLSTLPDSPSMKLQKAIMLKQMYGQDPNKNQDELDKKVFDAAGYSWNEVVADKGKLMGSLSATLNRLTMEAKAPDFNPNTPQGREIIAQIQQITGMLQGGQGSNLNGPPMPQGAPELNPVAAAQGQQPTATSA